MAFTQELLLFHFHTTDHVGLEGQYHWLLQEIILVSLSVIFQGLWLIVMGYMLWTSEFAPKGCGLRKDNYGRDVIKCSDEESLHRAKALVNILFSWFFIGMMGFGVSFYWSVRFLR
ncbi:uncharacterized protein LOC141629475 [Silene latifolia]|uniref:uncharacterized protein LOC141629475 n=1 Tax=Silene latifolia TaxID=37657 RepID=UPI003D7860FE